MLGIIIFLFITIFICVLLIIKQWKIIKQNRKETFIGKRSKYYQELQDLESQVKKLIKEREQQKLINSSIQKEADELWAERTHIVEQSISEIKKAREATLAQEIDYKREQMLEQAKIDHEKILTQMLNEQAQLNNLIEPLRAELSEYKEKRAAINQSIQRERQLEMEQDFHRIALSTEAQEDIKYLLSIEMNIHNKEVLRKLIYETYVRPALMEMIKRVLDNQDPCGIYKITDSQGLIYIGKSTKVKSRWQSHCKEALGIGGISHQEIHNALKIRGWNDFTFELLETCEKNKLNEREKFYIDFYESAKLGYNMKAGG